MTDKNKTIENRRKLLKSVAAGGGAIIAGKTLPEKWTRPAVDSVMLPAHAQTSSGPFSGTLVAALSSDNMFAQAMDVMVPQANAQPNRDFDIDWCVEPGEVTATARFLVVNEAPRGGPCWASLYKAKGVPVGVRTELTYSDGCADQRTAAEWLNKMGLVKDALASAPAYVTLDGLKAGDSFRFEDESNSIDETSTLVPGACNIAPVDCGKCKGD